jgi:hypothetical protein
MGAPTKPKYNPHRELAQQRGSLISTSKADIVCILVVHASQHPNSKISMAICVSLVIPATNSYPIMQHNLPSNKPETPRTNSGNIEPATELPSTLSGQPTLVWHPTPTDVIFGRSNASYEHFGNRSFRAIMGMHSKRYLTLRRQSDKSNFVKEIYSRMKDEGIRFLKSAYPNDDPSGGYTEVDTKRARVRISQSLRYAADRTPETFGLEQVALRVGNASSSGGNQGNMTSSALSSASDFRSSMPLMGTSLETKDSNSNTRGSLLQIFEPSHLTYSLNQQMHYGSGREDDPFEPIPLAPSVNKSANTTEEGEEGIESFPLQASTSGLVASFLQRMPTQDLTSYMNSACLPPPQYGGQESDSVGHSHVYVSTSAMSLYRPSESEEIMSTAGAIATTNMNRSSSHTDFLLLLQRLEEARRAAADTDD